MTAMQHDMKYQHIDSIGLVFTVLFALYIAPTPVYSVFGLFCYALAVYFASTGPPPPLWIAPYLNLALLATGRLALLSVLIAFFWLAWPIPLMAVSAWLVLLLPVRTWIPRDVVAVGIRFGGALVSLTAVVAIIAGIVPASQYMTNTAYEDSQTGAALALPLAQTVAKIHEQYISPVGLRIDGDWCQLNHVAWSLGCGNTYRLWHDRTERFNSTHIPHHRCITFNADWNTERPTPSPSMSLLLLKPRCEALHLALQELERFGYRLRTSLFNRIEGVEHSLIHYHDLVRSLPDSNLLSTGALCFTSCRVLTPTFQPTSYIHQSLLALLRFLDQGGRLGPVYTMLSDAYHMLIGHNPRGNRAYDSARAAVNSAWTEVLNHMSENLKTHLDAANTFSVNLRKCLEAYPGADASDNSPVFLHPSEVNIRSVLSKASMESLTPGLDHPSKFALHYQNHDYRLHSVIPYALDRTARDFRSKQAAINATYARWQQVGCDVGGFRVARRDGTRVEEEVQSTDGTVVVRDAWEQVRQVIDALGIWHSEWTEGN